MVNNDICDVLLNCLENVIKYSKRSNKRIIPLHSFLGNNISKDIQYEVTLDGLFNKKNVDLYSDINKTAYEVKLILCNYKQNSNNYFENMIGATVNLKLKNYRIVQIIFLPTYLPYFNKDGVLKRVEYVSNKDIEKYKELMNEYHIKPDNLLLCQFDTGNEDFLKNNINNKIDGDELFKSYHISMVSTFNDEIESFMNEYGNLDKFIAKESLLNGTTI